MINHIYIDNFKCFVNFKYEPSSIELILGDNGSGKSSLFAIVRKLKDLVVEGSSSLTVFPGHELCQWSDNREQSFEIGFKRDESVYRYQLRIEHDLQGAKNRISHEELKCDDVTLYRFDGKDAHLFKDDGSEGPTLAWDWNKSFLATVPERKENQKLTWFRERMSKTFVFAPDPLGMSADSLAEVEMPDYQLRNISSWLRHLFQEDLDAMTEIRDSLKQVMAGMKTFKHEKTSQKSRSLQFQFDFTDAGKDFWLPLDDLSDGQCQLVALYSIEHAMLKANRTVCIDEPDNFVALREIQPWLINAKDAVEDNDSQLWVISHNPELIDYLAADHGVQFYRDEGGPVRTKRFDWKDEDVLKPSEIVARGWE